MAAAAGTPADPESPARILTPPMGRDGAGLRIGMVSVGASPLTALDAAAGNSQCVHVDALSRALAARGHEVVIHARRDGQDVPARVQLAPRVAVEHVEAGPHRPLSEDEVLGVLPRFASELAHRWLQRPPDVAHAHSWESGVATVRAAAALGIPVSVTFHTLGSRPDPQQRGSGMSPRIEAERSLARYAHRLIATSRIEAHEIVGLGAARERVAVVPPGVDTTEFSPHGAQAPRRSWRHRVLWVGDLGRGSGADDAIRMVAHVPVCELVVAGGPPATGLARDPDVARLRQLAQALEVADRVAFVGAVRRADEPALIRSADVVVCLPPAGMTPPAVLEAMACGRPVVATAVGGLLDAVEDGVTGLVVQPQSPSSAGLAVRRLLSAPGLRAAMGEQARRAADQRYDWRYVGDAVEAVYQTMRASPVAPGLPLARLPRLSERSPVRPLTGSVHTRASVAGVRAGEVHR